MTIDGRLPNEEQVRPGERLRPRLLDVTKARIFAPSFEDLPVRMIAIPANPVSEPVLEYAVTHEEERQR